jgi:hypothetical protein
MNYAAPVAGIEAPIVIGTGSQLLGPAMMMFSTPLLRPYFRRRPETADPRSGIAEEAHA